MKHILMLRTSHSCSDLEYINGDTLIVLNQGSKRCNACEYLVAMYFGIALLMRVVETLMVGEETYPKELSYIMSYFIHGYFGIIYQWIQYGFDETPEQVEQHVMAAIASAAKSNKK